MHATIQPLQDQPSKWTVFSTPLAVEDARNALDATAKADGRRHDRSGIDLRQCSITTIVTGERQYRLPVLRTARGGVLLRSHAFNQLCGLAGAPAAYLRKLPAPLANQALDWGLRNYTGAPVTVRAAESPEGEWSARAIVSGRFAFTMDDRRTLDALMGALDTAGITQDVHVVALATGRTTNLRITFREQFDGPDGVPLTLGWDFRNSEVGTSALKLAPVLYRMVCTNGVVSQDQILGGRAWRHVGDDRELFEAFCETLPVVLDAAQEYPERVSRAHADVISIADARRALAAKTDTTKLQQIITLSNALAYADGYATASDTDGLSADIIDSADVQARKITRWQLVNGLTEAAQRETNETRMQLESGAAKLLAA